MEKHPEAQLPSSSALTTQSSSLDFHPVIFESLSSDLIRSSALRIGGSPGPSGLDAAAWKRLCASFHSSS